MTESPALIFCIFTSKHLKQLSGSPIDCWCFLFTLTTLIYKIIFLGTIIGIKFLFQYFCWYYMADYKKRESKEACRDKTSYWASLWGRAGRQCCWICCVARFKIHHDISATFGEIWQMETNWLHSFSLSLSCFIHSNIPLFCSLRTVEYKIPGNKTQTSEYLCV